MKFFPIIGTISKYTCPACKKNLIQSGPYDRAYYCNDEKCVVHSFYELENKLYIYNGNHLKLFCEGNYQQCVKIFQNVKVFL